MQSLSCACDENDTESHMPIFSSTLGREECWKDCFFVSPQLGGTAKPLVAVDLKEEYPPQQKLAHHVDVPP